MAYDTVANIISKAAKELGLVSAAIADPFASTDPNILQLLGFLESMGREIVHEREWTHLQTEYTFNTVNGTALYNLPADFRQKIPQTEWNRTTRFPLGGPLSPQEWQYLKAIPAAQTITLLFRPRNQKLEIYPTPTSVQTIAYEYLTSYWVAVSGSVTPTKDAPSLKDDVPLFDPNLLLRAVKMAWKRDKGFDSFAAQQDYEKSLDQAADDDAEAPILRIGGGSGVRTRLLDDLNIPSTGYNQ